MPLHLRITPREPRPGEEPRPPTTIIVRDGDKPMLNPLCPIVCGSIPCNHIFFATATGISMAHGSLEMSPGVSTSAKCPKCGAATSYFVPGKYDVVDARFLFTPLSEAEETAILKAIGILQNAVANRTDPEQVKREGRKSVSTFAALWDYLPSNKEDAYKAIPIVLSALSLLVATYSALKPPATPAPVEVVLPPGLVEAIQTSRQHTLSDSRSERNRQLKSVRSKQSEGKRKRPYR